MAIRIEEEFMDGQARPMDEYGVGRLVEICFSVILGGACENVKYGVGRLVEICFNVILGEACESVEGCNEKDVICELVVVLNEDRVVALFDNDDTIGPEIDFEEEIIKAIRIEKKFMGGILVDPLMDGD
ncbi:hypothetical protein V6N12_076468 [Hibiscus sabdariffa]|uniref:Uncharacterized protein n=1 Tax=Hibiscus sabdariffa TaxID=183260 RepID=A0ABR2DAR6_9ROSI